MVKCCVDDEKLVYKLMAWINWTELHSSDFEIVDTNVTRIFVVLLDFKIDLTLLFWIRYKFDTNGIRAKMARHTAKR